MNTCCASVYTDSGEPDHTTTSARLPTSSVPITWSSPSTQAGLAVIQRSAAVSLTAMPAALAAAIALAASWFSRWMPIGESEWIVAMPPCSVNRPAFSGMPSNASILKPHQSAQVLMAMPSATSRSRIL